MYFFEALERRSREVGGPLCVGIDPRLERGEDIQERLVAYGERIVRTTLPYAAAFKPNTAFFECHGASGWRALERILSFIGPEIPVILDAKRGDIGSTAEAYAAGLLDRPGTLALTLSPYLGKESVAPFLKRKNCGIFLLCRTSNPGAERIQGLPLADGTPLYGRVAEEGLSWGEHLGLVVAGNVPDSLEMLRKRHPEVWFLAPGVGSQGGNPTDAMAAGARKDGWGLLVSVSRSIAEADDPAHAARQLRDSLNKAREGRLTFTSFPSQKNVKPLSSLTLRERQEFLDGLFTIGAFNVGNFTLKSGKVSPFYLDLRRISSRPELLRFAGRAYGELLWGLKADSLAGIPVAALPLATAAALECNMNLIYPRMEKKEHGSGARIEGNWSPGQRAVLLDDLITTGKSKLEAVRILREAGIVVEDLVVLLERGQQGRRELNREGIRLHAWTSMSELLEAGKQRNRISLEEKEVVEVYVRNN